MVLKENNYEVTASSYDFGEAGSASGGGRKRGAPVAKPSSKRQIAGRDYTHESTCLVCWDGGQVLLCDRCPCAFHASCLGMTKADIAKVGSSQWSCPHHSCLVCDRKAQAVGGLIFRCECCPNSYCEDHLPIDAELIGRCTRFEALGMRHPDQVSSRRRLARVG